MPLNIKKPSDKRYCKANVFAPAGAGKTVMLGTAQEDERTSPMLLLDFEGGYESLAGLDVDVAECRDWNDFNEAFELLSSPNTKYKSCGIDSISEIHKWILLDILDKEGAGRKDPDLIEQRDYGKATVLLRRLLREFRDLPMHVFYVSHAKEVEIPREGRVRVPDLAGQMAEEVSGLMSVQGYLAQFEEEGEQHRTLLLHSFPRFRIKARTPWGVAIPEEIVDPTIGDLLDVLGFNGADTHANEIAKRGSSRGKQVEEEVPEDSRDRLPGAETGRQVKEGVPEGEPEVEKEEETPENTQDGSELPNVSWPVKKVDEYAKNHEVDLEGCRTKSQKITRIQDTEKARVG